MNLINIFELLQSLVSGVVTCSTKRNHALNGVNMFTSWLLWFFRVVGWWREYNTREGNSADLSLLRLRTTWLYS